MWRDESDKKRPSTSRCTWKPAEKVQVSKLPNLRWTRACYGAESRHRHVGERIAIAAAVIAVAIERVLRLDVVDRFRPEDRGRIRAFD